MEKVETVTSDADSVFTFRNFDYGDWIIKETAAPEGYCRLDDIYFHVGSDWKEPTPIMCVNIPDHYEFKKTDSSGEPLEGVKFRLEDEDGKKLGIYTSDKDGIVSITDLTPGTYFIKEIETLEGFTLSGEVIKVKLDEYYAVPEKMRTLVNYTTIQTGVNGCQRNGRSCSETSSEEKQIIRRDVHKAFLLPSPFGGAALASPLLESVC